MQLYTAINFVLSTVLLSSANFWCTTATPPHDNDDAITFDDQHQLHIDDEVPVDADDVQDLLNEEFNVTAMSLVSF